MKITPTILLFFLCMGCCSHTVLSQSSCYDRIDHSFIEESINRFVAKQDGISYGRKSELIMLILPVDSTGNISSLNIMADEKRSDKVYKILSTATPAILSSRKFKGCEGKIIIVPIVTINRSEKDKQQASYPETIQYDPHSFFSIPTLENIGVVFTKPVYYFMPFYSEHEVTEYIGSYVDTRKKSNGCDSAAILHQPGNGLHRSNVLTEMESNNIYTACLRHYYEDKPVNLVIPSITDNREIIRPNYTELMRYFGTRRNFFYHSESIDATWIDYFKEANSIKFTLLPTAIPHMTSSVFSIHILSADSINRINKTHGGLGFEKTFGQADKIVFSSIIYIKDRAIVEMSRYGDLLDGNGTIFFLRKINGLWKVMAILPTWIS